MAAKRLKKISKPSAGTSSAGSKKTVWAFVAYFVQIIPVLGPIVALLIYLTQKDSFTRFHAMQALLLWLSLALISIILVASIVGAILLPLLSVLALLVWLYMLYKSYSGERTMLPVIGGLAAQHS